MALPLRLDPGRKPRFPKKPIWILIAALALVLALFVVTAVDKQNVTGLENVFGFIVRPVQSGLHNATVAVSNAIYGLFDSKDLEAANIELQEQVEQLKLQADEVTELRQENQRLAELLGAKEELYSDLDVAHARVVGKSPGYWFDVFLIDQGEKDGIRKDMAVVNADGLVGRIVEVGSTWSKVMTLVDGDSSVAGLLERTRDNGMVKGTVGLEGDNGMLRMYYLPFDANLTSGDRVVTSGMGGYFQKGLLIGTVLEVDRSTDSGEQYALIKPAVDFQHLENVLVLPLPEEVPEVTE